MKQPIDSVGDRRRVEFERFVVETTDPMLRAAYLVVGDLSEAEDLVQECLIRVAKRWPRVRRMTHPRAYARRVLINLALDRSRGYARQRDELDRAGAVADARDHAATDLSTVVETRSELVQALSALAPRQRAVLVLRYFEDLSEVDTAAALGCSVGTVKSTTSRALSRLQTNLAATTTKEPR